MFELLKTNIVWIKDIFTLLFAGTATVIAVLTYRRARATFLQPIRSEVIKRQSELLSGFLKTLKDNHSFESKIDYVNIVQINVLCALRDYGFVFKGQEEIFKSVAEEVVGWIPCSKSKTLEDIEIIGTFETKNNDLKSTNLGKQKFEKLKEGKIEIDKIYLTKTLSQFTKSISEFVNDPFMPQSIQLVLNDLVSAINQNLVQILKIELEQFMLSFSEKYFETGEAPNFDPVGVYNNFNHKRIHHRNSIDKLKKEIRKYLLIDKPW